MAGWIGGWQQWDFNSCLGYPCPLLPTQTTATSEGPGMVIGKLFWFLLVWLPHQVVVLEKGVFPKE